MEINKRKNNTREIILTALMIALIFIGGSILKIPTFNGVMQFGDCMLLIAAVILDKRKAFIAGAIGMSLVDLSAGYLIWVPFTFVIKGLMAYVTSIIAHKYNKTSKGLLFAFVIGVIISLVGYFIANAIMGGVILKVVSGFNASIIYAAAHFVGDLIPLVVAVIIALPLSVIFKKIIK